MEMFTSEALTQVGAASLVNCCESTSIQSTMIYARVDLSRVRDAVEMLPDVAA